MASPGHLVNQHNRCRRGPTGWRRWRPSPLRHNNCHRDRGSSGWRHWRVSPLRHRLGHRMGGPTDGAAGARPPVPLSASGARLGRRDMTHACMRSELVSGRARRTARRMAAIPYPAPSAPSLALCARLVLSKAPVSLVAPSLCSGCPVFAHLLSVLPLSPCPCPLPSSLPALDA